VFSLEGVLLPLNYTRISQTADGKAAIGDRREYRATLKKVHGHPG
jgi:hypothetical protein